MIPIWPIKYGPYSVHQIKCQSPGQSDFPCVKYGWKSDAYASPSITLHIWIHKMYGNKSSLMMACQAILMVSLKCVGRFQTQSNAHLYDAPESIT